MCGRGVWVGSEGAGALLRFDNAGHQVARALAELLAAVSMVTGSRGARLVEGGGRVGALALQCCLWGVLEAQFW